MTPSPQMTQESLAKKKEERVKREGMKNGGEEERIKDNRKKEVK